MDNVKEFLVNRDFSNVPTIPEYYKGKTIFITGGTGFMGKVLIEKLLYSCPGLDRIYLLMRSKKGVSPDDRLAQIYSSNCFDRLREVNPTIFNSKVFITAGDTMAAGLGLSEEDRTLLVNRVNIIFHVAASVRFDDPLTFAAKMNLGGTKEIVELAKEVRHLSCLLHVSTSYSNTNRDIIEEKMYPPHADWRETMNICEKTDEHTLRALTAKYLGEIPNTYTFTKQLAEHVVFEQKGKLPVVIFRPSIVVSSLEEPVPGWLENFNGPAGLMVASGKGIMRSIYTNPEVHSDFIPVDISIKSMMAAAWARGTKELSTEDDVPIFNSCGGAENQISLKAMTDLAKEVYPTIPLDNMLWSVGGDHTKCKFNHYIKVILLHLLPAMFLDMLIKLAGHKPLLVKIQRRIYIANLAVEYYLTKQWTFDNQNSILLRDKLKEEDKKEFYYETDVDLKKFMYRSLLGGRRYLLKEKDEDIPKAKVHFKRMAILDIVVRYTFYFYIFWRLIHSTYIQNFLNNIWDTVNQ